MYERRRDGELSAERAGLTCSKEWHSGCLGPSGHVSQKGKLHSERTSIQGRDEIQMVTSNSKCSMIILERTYLVAVYSTHELILGNL